MNEEGEEMCVRINNDVACTKPSVGDCFVIGGRLVNTYFELHFRSNQFLPIVLVRHEFRGIISEIAQWGATGSYPLHCIS